MQGRNSRTVSGGPLALRSASAFKETALTLVSVPLPSMGPRGAFTDVSHKVLRVGHIFCDGKGPPPRGAEVLGLRAGAERAGVLPAKAGEPSGREGAGGAAVVRCGQEPDSVSFRGRLYRV